MALTPEIDSTPDPAHGWALKLWKSMPEGERTNLDAKSFFEGAKLAYMERSDEIADAYDEGFGSAEEQADGFRGVSGWVNDNPHRGKS